MRHVKTLAGVILLAFAGMAQAQTVDCAQARSPVETLVCSDEALVEMDHQLDALAQRRITESPYFRDAHATWLDGRVACSDRDCLVEYYARRISFLSPTAATVAPEPSFAEAPMEAIDLDADPYADSMAAGLEVAASEAQLQEVEAVDSDIVLAEGRITGARKEGGAGTSAVPSPAAPAGSSIFANARAFWVAVAIALVALLAMSAAAGFGWVVFYADGRDFGWSLVPAGLALLTGIAYFAAGAGEGGPLGALQWSILAAGASSVLAATVWSIAVSARHNGGAMLGVLVGVSKVLVAALMLFSLLANLARRQKEDYHRNTVAGRRERAAARTSFVILGGLWWLLVNGERVEARRSRA